MSVYVYKYGKKGWRVIVTHEDKRVTKTFRDALKKDAKRWGDNQYNRLKSAADPYLSKLPTVAEILHWYLDEIAPELKGEGYRNKVGIVRNVLLKQKWAKKKINELTAVDIRDFKKKELRRGLAESTVRHRLTTLSAAITAYSEDVNPLVRNVVLEVRKPRAHANPRTDIIKGMDSGQLPNLVGGQRGIGEEANYSEEDDLAIRLALSTGCRRGELVNLTRQDFDYVNNLVHFVHENTKDWEDRWVPAQPILMKLIKEFFDKDPERQWFYQKTPQTLTKRFKKAAIQMGRPDLVLHHTRHNALTRMAGEMNPWDLMLRSGHGDFKMLKKYISVAKLRKQGAAQGSALTALEQLKAAYGPEASQPRPTGPKPKDLSRTRRRLKAAAEIAEQKPNDEDQHQPRG